MKRGGKESDEEVLVMPEILFTDSVSVNPKYPVETIREFVGF